MSDKSNWTTIHPLYTVAENIIQRCNNPKNTNYFKYGARGIECRIGRTSGEVFRYLIGLPGYFPGAQLDRIDNDGHYEHGNLRWVTPRENILNSTQCKDKEYYSTYPSSRANFKRICNKRSWDINDFEEVASDTKWNGRTRYNYILKNK